MCLGLKLYAKIKHVRIKTYMLDIKTNKIIFDVKYSTFLKSLFVEEKWSRCYHSNSVFDE